MEPEGVLQCAVSGRINVARGMDAGSDPESRVGLSGISCRISGGVSSGSARLLPLDRNDGVWGYRDWPVISDQRSFQLGLSFSINAIFHSRRHLLSRFSRRIANSMSSYISK